MILVDTSVWIDHLKAQDERLTGLLQADQVLIHPFVTGEIALGNLRARDIVLKTLHNLPQAGIARDDEVLHLIKAHALFGLGIGYVDAHLLASARLTSGVFFWTRDKRLLAAAIQLGLSRGLH